MKKHSIERFIDGIQKSDYCWYWNKGKDKDGYGKMFADGKHIRSHRFSYEITFGKIPDGLLVLHKCDNPSCVRPSHLFCGTAKDNTQDMIKKGRYVLNATPCDIFNNKKLTQEQVNEIRIKYKTGDFIYNDLAKIYNVSKSTINYVVNFKSWK